jgi:hypothetical protein
MSNSYLRKLITVNLGPGKSAKAFLYYFNNGDIEYTNTSLKPLPFNDFPIVEVSTTARLKADGRIEIPKSLFDWKPGTTVYITINNDNVQLSTKKVDKYDRDIKVDPFSRLRVPMLIMKQAGFDGRMECKITRVDDTITIKEHDE